MDNARRTTQQWPAPIKPHLQHLAAASSAGTSLEANLKHITVTLATWDAVWEVYLDPKWARQWLRLHGAQDRALEQFFKTSEKEMAELSMKRHGRAKQLVVFFGAAGRVLATATHTRMAELNCVRANMALALRASSASTVRTSSRIAVKASRPLVRSVRVFADTVKKEVEVEVNVEVEVKMEVEMEVKKEVEVYISAVGPRRIRAEQDSTVVLQTRSPVETAVKEAEEACKDGSTKDCAAAWDTVGAAAACVLAYICQKCEFPSSTRPQVEEVSAAISDKRAAAKAMDPLEQYCEGAPDADECRVYGAYKKALHLIAPWQFTLSPGLLDERMVQVVLLHADGLCILYCVVFAVLLAED
ncbi:hypothetical protein QJQ45_015771 [Haematococcus lacustris]|nr:hypothetical protein QJQ45_015771 [Haematococcus lacustris]